MDKCLDCTYVTLRSRSLHLLEMIKLPNPAVIDFEDTKGNFSVVNLVMSLCRTGFTAKGA